MSLAPAPRINIYEAAGANRVRTFLLIVFFTLFVVALGYVVGEYTAPGGGLVAVPFAVGVSAMSAAGSYFAGDKVVLGMSRAERIRRLEAMG